VAFTTDSTELQRTATEGNAGFRVITYDPWTGYDYDTLAADLNVLVKR
jgi:hypothetical protein